MFTLEELNHRENERANPNISGCVSCEYRPSQCNCGAYDDEEEYFDYEPEIEPDTFHIVSLQSENQPYDHWLSEVKGEIEGDEGYSTLEEAFEAAKKSGLSAVLIVTRSEIVNAT